MGVYVVIYDFFFLDGELGVEVFYGMFGEFVVVKFFFNIFCVFWGDKFLVVSLGLKYYSFYFNCFFGVWVYGDFCVIYFVIGNIFFFGRVDGVFNFFGVRFGLVEIYGVVERWFVDKI